MKWNATYDSKADVLYFTHEDNRPARAIEMGGGVLFRFAFDTGELVGVTLTNLPAVEGRVYEKIDEPVG